MTKTTPTPAPTGERANRPLTWPWRQRILAVMETAWQSVAEDVLAQAPSGSMTAEEVRDYVPCFMDTYDGGDNQAVKVFWEVSWDDRQSMLEEAFTESYCR